MLKLGEGGFGCVYYPSISCSTGKFDHTNKKKITKIEMGDEESIAHEIHVSEKVMKIPHFDRHFSPILDSCKLQYKKIQKDIVKDCSIAKREKDAFLLHMNIVDGITFDEYFIQNKMNVSTKERFKRLLFSYNSLMMSFKLLNEHNIIHCDVKKQNIMMNRNTMQPIIIDFGLSILPKEFSEKKVDFTFYTFMPSYSIWAPEYHACCYLARERPSKLTTSIIREISQSIVSGNKVLLDIIDTFKLGQDVFESDLYNSLLAYKNKDYFEVIHRLLNDSGHTWDLWSLHLNYIMTLKHLRRENTIVDSFINLCLRNISFNYKERRSYNDSIETFNHIFLDKKIKIHEYVDVVDDYAQKGDDIKKYFYESLPKEDVKSLRKPSVKK